MLGDGRVVEVVGRQELVDGVGVVLVPSLFDVPAHYCLVLFGGHESSPSRRFPAIVARS
jgi:hypothetical protein